MQARRPKQCIWQEVIVKHILMKPRSSLPASLHEVGRSSIETDSGLLTTKLLNMSGQGGQLERLFNDDLMF